MNLLKIKVFKNLILPLIPMLLWGSLFPFIKIGYSAFNINTASIADILMFAALRFAFCGLIVCGAAYLNGENLKCPKYKNIFNITLMGVFAIVLHYSFAYVGLSLADSSKTAILKQLGALFYVCFAFIFVKNERFSIYKILGALVGFCGIIVINAGNGGIGFNLGDALIILASVCTVVANVMSKQFVKGNSPLWITGISQLTGGIILFIIAITTGGNLPAFSIKGLLVFTYICTASIIAYTV